MLSHKDISIRLIIITRIEKKMNRKKKTSQAKSKKDQNIPKKNGHKDTHIHETYFISRVPQTIVYTYLDLSNARKAPIILVFSISCLNR